ncbi:flagellum site-determining protein YlxH [Paraliobacillus ryukyuensis]|uniref:Flagellar biosynthesis protein FlhG n=1 Tax=Paraliobacillus ryukyuensis TaxID=200904 RepID=A0A366EH46_9BACI|nr:MinD/ParA family protein [Paraliobacillus ryukyuensis]RBP01781.1 flagellar biosynthesis protein FlhG [Paraliobacillus ryukyuensis]
MTDQAANLRKQIQRSQANKHAKTISVVSGKGGVGKSNFSLNFALTLTKRDRKVLLFDLDIGMGNLDILMGLQPKSTIVEMYEKELPIHDIIEVGPNGLSYIAGGSGLTNVFRMDQAKQNYFLQQLDELLFLYDYIIFDMGAGATADTLHYVLASDETIVITTPEPTSMMDAYAMMKHITNYNNKSKLYLVVNQSQTPKDGNQIVKRLQEAMRRFLEMEITPLGILPQDKVVSKAVLNQTPFSIYDSKAKITVALEELVTQYDTGEINLHQKGPSTFISKLLKFVKER